MTPKTSVRIRVGPMRGVRPPSDPLDPPRIVVGIERVVAWMSEWSRRQIQDLLAKAAWVQVPFHAIAYFNFFIIPLTTFNIWQVYTGCKGKWVSSVDVRVG